MQLDDNTVSIFFQQTLHVPCVVALIEAIAFSTLKIAITFIVTSIHVLTVNKVPAIGFLKMNYLSTTDATTETVSITIS